MMTTYCFFSFRGDEDCLRAAIRAVRHTDKLARVAVFDDIDHPLEKRPLADIYRRTAFKRNGNLNGRECILAELGCMLGASEGCEWVCKVDCDTIVQGLEWMGSEAELVGRAIRPNSILGPFYCVRRSALPGMIYEASANHDIPSPEDQGVSRAALVSGARIEDGGERHLSAFRYRNKLEMRDYALADAVTFGNRHEIKEDQPRKVAARAMRSYWRAKRGKHEMDFSCQAVDAKTWV